MGKKPPMTKHEPTPAQVRQQYAATLRIINDLRVERDEAIAALKMLLAAFESVLPGIRYIAVKDYKLVNDAPVAAERVIAKAKARR